MGCEICGRSSCCSSFHSAEEQQAFDDIADKVKDKAISVISNRVKSIDGHYHGDNYYVKLDDVVKIIEGYY